MRDDSLVGKRLGESDINGEWECNTFGVVEKECEGLELGIIEGVELGKEEDSTLWILLGIWEGIADTVGNCKSAAGVLDGVLDTLWEGLLDGNWEG